MSKGILIIVIFALLMLLATTGLTDNSEKIAEEEQLQKLSSELEEIDIYIDKLMFKQASEKYQSVIKNNPDNYEISDNYISFCEEHDYTEELLMECLRRFDLDNGNIKVAEKIMQIYNSSESKKLYSFMRENQELFIENELYDQIKLKNLGKIKTVGKKAYTVQDWQSLGYTIVGSEDGKKGIVTKNGVMKVPMEYDDIISYSDKEAYIAILDNEILVYANSVGERQIVPYDYTEKTVISLDYAGPFERGVTNVCLDGKWGYSDINMNMGYLDYKHTTPFSCGVSAALGDKGWQLLNYSFESITDICFKDVYRDEFGYCCFNNIMYLKSDDKWQMYKVKNDENGTVTSVELCSPLEFDDVKAFGEYGAVCVNGKWGFVTDSGEWLIDPVYSDAYSFRCGLAPVLINGKWGYISENNKIVIAALYDDAISFNSNGVSAAKKDNEWHFFQLEEYYYLGR